LLSTRVEGICELRDQLHPIVVGAALQGGIWAANNSTANSLFRIHRLDFLGIRCLEQSLPGRVLKDFNFVIRQTTIVLGFTIKIGISQLPCAGALANETIDVVRSFDVGGAVCITSRLCSLNKLKEAV
jgi:hypothetical protein